LKIKHAENNYGSRFCRNKHSTLIVKFWRFKKTFWKVKTDGYGITTIFVIIPFFFQTDFLKDPEKAREKALDTREKGLDTREKVLNPKPAGSENSTNLIA
jgi:hypothetical protein